MPTRNHWPILVIALVAGFSVLSAWSFLRASREVSAVTDTEYYSHGLRYDQTLLERNAATTLGWNANVSLDGRQLQVVLTDRARQPVNAATGMVTLVGGKQGASLHLPMIESTRGIYLAALPANLRGEQTVQIDFERDGARLGRRLLLALP